MGKGRPLRKAFAGLIVGTVVLAAPAGASAATFYVDDSASSPDNPCTNPAPDDACTTITAAIIQARGPMFPGGDTIMIAAGNYPESVALNDDADVGNVLDGAGSGTGGTSTVLPLDPGESVSVVKDDITIRDLTVLGNNVQTFRVGWVGSSTAAATGVVLDNLLIRNNITNNLWALHIDAADDVTLNDVQVDGDEDWDRTIMGAEPTAALRFSSAATDVVVNDSELFSNDVGVDVQNSSVMLNRSTIGATTTDLANDQPAVRVLTNISAASSLTLDSSLVIRGDHGVEIDITAGVMPSASATIRNSTIDPGNPKGSDQTGVGVAGSTTSVTLDSSIVMGTLVSEPGSGTMNCTHSDVQDTEQPAPNAISCDTSAGNVGNNSTSTPAQLFDPNILFPNYSLLAGGPAIDTGNPAPLTAGESNADLPGNARVLDGNLDCVARRDKGAVEETGLSAACPTPPAAPTTLLTPASTPAKAKKKCKKKKKRKRRASTSAKKKKCKKRKRKR